MSDPLVLIGRVAGAFGVRGEVRLRAFGEDPLNILGYGTLLDGQGRPVLTFVSGRAAGGELIGRARECDTREAAEALKGRDVYVPRNRLPPPEEDEFYIVDLIGLEAVSPDGAFLGRVKAVQNYGAGDLLEVQPPQGGSFLVAFTLETVPEIRLAEGRLLLARPSEVEATPDEEDGGPAP